MRTRGRINANILSEGEGRPVVLLHGALSSKLQWYFLMKQLSPYFRVIALDLQGYGDSRFPAETADYRLGDEIAHIESVLSEVLPQGAAFHLAGHSYGGAVALRMAGDADRLGKRILSLSLYEPVAFHLLSPDDEALQEDIYVARGVSELVERHEEMGAVRFFIDHWNGPDYFNVLPKMIRDAFAAVIRKLPLDFNALFRESLTLEDYCKAVTQPVLIMAGLSSPRSPRKLAELLNDHLPNARLRWINGGHLAPILNANEVNSHIVRFIMEAEQALHV